MLDLVARAPTRAIWARVMNPSFASIMPQAVASWCEQAGHDVTFVCYTGFENLLEELPKDLDVLFVSAFSQAGQLSYALSNMFQQRGCVTVLGGPHARCYPDDARKYFDYVLGFTDKSIVARVLEECQPRRPWGEYLAASQQPPHLPGVRERWKYIEPTIMKSLTRIKGVPMIGSLGCPYSCSFCIDSTVPYQPMDYGEIGDDLRFLVEKMPKAWIAWHDPNFGVRFDDYMGIIDDAVPPGTLNFAAESSLSLLSEDRVKRLGEANFKVMLPGIESWYGFGAKAKTGKKIGMEKMEHVSDHVNMILRYIPYVQTNFVIGLDDDEGAEPFELTKKFLERTPGAFPGYSLLACFGEAAPLNIDLQRAGRVRPFPFHFLNNNQAMNVHPKNYEWTTFYDHLIDLCEYSFSLPSMARRFRATPPLFAKGLNVVRTISTEGYGRIKYHKMIRRMLGEDRHVRDFFEGDTDTVPPFYVNRVREDLGPFWDYLPEGAMNHDPNAYMKRIDKARVEEPAMI